MTNWIRPCIGLLLLIPACGGDKGETTASATETSTITTATESASMPTTEPTGDSAGTTAGTASESASGTTTTGPGESTSPSEPPDTTTSPPEMTETTSPTEGPPVGCDGLSENACADADACMAIVGTKVNLEKMCTQKSMFLACVDATGCDDAITYGCPIGVDPPEPYEFSSTCLPPDFEPCDAGEVTGPC